MPPTILFLYLYNNFDHLHPQPLAVLIPIQRFSLSSTIFFFHQPIKSSWLDKVKERRRAFQNVSAVKRVKKLLLRPNLLRQLLLHQFQLRLHPQMLHDQLLRTLVPLRPVVDLKLLVHSFKELVNSGERK